MEKTTRPWPVVSLKDTMGTMGRDPPRWVFSNFQIFFFITRPPSRIMTFPETRVDLNRLIKKIKPELKSKSFQIFKNSFSWGDPGGILGDPGGILGGDPGGGSWEGILGGDPEGGILGGDPGGGFLGGILGGEPSGGSRGNRFPRASLYDFLTLPVRTPQAHLGWGKKSKNQNVEK